LIDGTFGGLIRFDDYERAGDYKADRAVYIRFVPDDADAQGHQLLIPSSPRWDEANRTAQLARPFVFPGAFPNFFVSSPAM
jgi:hypothetical protein